MTKTSRLVHNSLRKSHLDSSKTNRAHETQREMIGTNAHCIVRKVAAPVRLRGDDTIRDTPASNKSTETKGAQTNFGQNFSHLAYIFKASSSFYGHRQAPKRINHISENSDESSPAGSAFFSVPGFSTCNPKTGSTDNPSCQKCLEDLTDSLQGMEVFEMKGGV
eukprot:CAMPEP_0172609292 /NCGR_PEP_ID=MMETSP1068-20121228/29310_1 /TAXON_ID=35684 /ORGANISM="Pseudopedinella elastica, Strain CCMP716" /LENGTH=163 /DNA_ID=CAMNT_0013412781 /DNA_START=141 /DNA_END=632 /DNA_ORIENTATION=+